LLNKTFAEARAQSTARIAELESERHGLEREMGRWNAEIHKLSKQTVPSDTASRLVDLHERIRDAERRTTGINEQVIALRQEMVDDREVALALSLFDPVWDALTQREQARIVHLLVERVDYDGAAGKVSITFRPSGIKVLAGEVANQPKEKIA
jgi:site-specific DNA recombinase